MAVYKLYYPSPFVTPPYPGNNMERGCNRAVAGGAHNYSIMMQGNSYGDPTPGGSSLFIHK